MFLLFPDGLTKPFMGLKRINMDRVKFYITPNDDGTITIVHWGTTFSHFWVSDIKKRRGNYFTVRIHGQKGAVAMLRIDSWEEVQYLQRAIKAAQDSVK